MGYHQKGSAKNGGEGSIVHFGEKDAEHFERGVGLRHNVVFVAWGVDDGFFLFVDDLGAAIEHWTGSKFAENAEQLNQVGFYFRIGISVVDNNEEVVVVVNFQFAVAESFDQFGLFLL